MIDRLRDPARLFASLVFALCAGCASQSPPAPEPGPIRVGSLTAVRSGDHGVPMIFVPGLSSGAWAWQPMADRFAKDHVVWVVTLDGFDGSPPAGPHPMARAEASLLDLIRQQHIDRPVLVGHSLGGTLAIALAETHADALAGVVAVDGLPVFPGTEQLPADARPAQAARVQASLPTDPATFRASQRGYMRSPGGVTDPELADTLAARSARSDPASVAAYLGDDLALDLRAGLPGIGVPVLVVVPYDAPDVANGPHPPTEADKTAYYTSLMRGTPRLDVVSIAPSRHFVMFDQPDRLAATIAAFVARIAPR